MLLSARSRATHVTNWESLYGRHLHRRLLLLFNIIIILLFRAKTSKTLPNIYEALASTLAQKQRKGAWDGNRNREETRTSTLQAEQL